MKRRWFNRLILLLAICLSLGWNLGLLYVQAGYAFAVMCVRSDELPEHLKDRVHNDYYIKSTQWIPRRWTFRKLVEPPVMILGSANHTQSQTADGGYGPSPLPLVGQWQVSAIQVKKGWPFYLPYIALTGTRYHFRAGVRWDNVDNYYVLNSIALRRTSSLK